MKTTLFKYIYLTSCLVIFTFFNANAQIYDPVEWSESMQDLGNGEVELIFTAEIEEHWHLYTQEVPDADDAPLPTTFYFPKSNDVERIGSVKESKSVTQFEEVSQLNISFFENHAEFRQRVKNTSLKAADYSVEVEFMVCDDKMCLPPAIEVFNFTIPVGQKIEEDSQTQVEEKEDLFSEPAVSIGSIEETEEEGGLIDPVSWNFKVESSGSGKYKLIMEADIIENWHIYATELESDEGPIPTTITIDENEFVELKGELKIRGELEEIYDPNYQMNIAYYSEHVEFAQEFELKDGGKKISGNVYFMSCDDEKCLPPEEITFDLEIPEETGGTVSSENSFWATFIKGFLGGFIALLTPCVFPMIPLTVSFFTKQSKTKAKGISNALLYGFSIILIYVLLGYGVTAIFGADALNALSTNVYFNLAFFVLLVVFAISFFGAFEITLPASWVNKADMASDKGGILGIFFMGFTLSLVSFSCTGPIIGTLLVEAAVNGGVAGPLIGMFGFSLALALPFALFAAFPGWLNTLPSSGGWLNSVKVVLGFLELAFAFKFLSNADLVVQAGLLKRELFIAIWIAIFGMMTLYLLGIFSLPHDSKSDRIGVARMMFAAMALMFTIYLIPGIWGAPLKMISGFPPPMFYSESPQGIGKTAKAVISSSGSQEIVGEPEHCPHQLNCFHDYEEGLAYAKEVGKPVMLDFTGWACVNCRKMEEQVWSDPAVLKILREDVVLISLYVDEKIELPKDEQVEVIIGKKTKLLKTVGNKWSYMQATRYNTNSQPYYIIMDHDENTMNGSAAYDPDVDKFLGWLNEGIDKFEDNKVATVH